MFPKPERSGVRSRKVCPQDQRREAPPKAFVNRKRAQEQPQLYAAMIEYLLLPPRSFLAAMKVTSPEMMTGVSSQNLTLEPSQL